MARPLKVAVQMDPIETVNIDADSTFALMLEAQARGHTLWHYEVRHMALKEGVSRPAGDKREERLFARGHKVKVARGFKGELTEKDIRDIVADIPKVLSD